MATEACTETLSDVERMLSDAANTFCKRYGGTFEEWRSEAHLVFMLAYYSFDSSKGVKFTSWLYTLLHYRLADPVKKPARAAKHIQQIPWKELLKEADRQGITISTIYRRKELCLDLFVSDLSTDAKQVVYLVLDSPMDIRLSLLERQKQGSVVSRMKGAVVEFLTDMGWTPERIKKSFQEVSEALR